MASARSAAPIRSNGESVVGDADPGVSTLPDHVIATPRPGVDKSDVKRMHMLPDVATWTGGTAVPLNEPVGVPVADEPS